MLWDCCQCCGTAVSARIAVIAVGLLSVLWDCCQCCGTAVSAVGLLSVLGLLS